MSTVIISSSIAPVNLHPSWNDYIRKAYHKNHDKIVTCKICNLEMPFYQTFAHKKRFHGKIYHCDICNCDVKYLTRHEQSLTHLDSKSKILS